MENIHFDFDALNPTFRDEEAFIDPPFDLEEEWEDEYFDEIDDDGDFPLSLEYDEGENDMYADGDFYTNDMGDW